MPVPSVSAGVNAVKEVDSSLHPFQNIGGSSHSHQVNRLIPRQMRNRLFYNIIHFLMALSHRQTSDGIAVKGKLSNLLCMLNSDIRKNSPLINPEQKLVPVDGILQSV